MLGTLVNVAAIIAGSLVGLIFRGRISEKYNKTIIQAISLGVILIGLKSAFKCNDFILIIISLALGSLLGELCKIEHRLENAGAWLEKKFSNKGGSFATGFVTTSLLYCVGAMAIVGSLESGLTGNHSTLFAKSTLDGIGSVIFSSTMGIGVLFSSVSVLLYQGTITLAAVYVKPFLVPEVISQMSSVGGLLIVAIGINMLGENKIKVGNMLPAVFIPLIYYIGMQIFIKL
ncbi:MAG: DUF554 domain-containing protein [Deltaproteobacteria bacterium]|nr:DUF554 domain-containing protein [Deltaproteobacteria bacterium]